MNDDFLYKFRKPPRREFAAALYQRISKPMKTNFWIPALRYIALTFTIFAVVTAVLFISPAARALADLIIGQFSGYTFVQGTPLPVQQDKTGEVKSNDQPQPDKDVSNSVAPDAAKASQLAGFTVISPSYVPAGYIPSSKKNESGGWIITSRWGGEAALIYFGNAADKGFLTIEELKIGKDRPRTVERLEIVAVTVRGLPGVWMPDDSGKSDLVWDENGVTFSIVSNILKLDEIQKIAEGLGK